MHAAALRYFEEIARVGSMRQAAERLNVAASAINRQILKLEDELGVQLFERLPRGLRLTPAGDLLLRHVRSTLHDFDRLRGEISELRGVKSGLVRIACLDSLLTHVMPDVISSFSRRHPAVTFLVESGVHGVVAHLVADGDVDIGVTFNLDHHPELMLSADIPMPIMAVMAADHPLSGHKEVSVSQCAAYPLLLQQDTHPIRSQIDTELQILHKLRRPLVACNNMALLKQLVLNGLGIAFYTPIGFLKELESGEIRAVPVESDSMSRLRVGLLMHRRRRPAPAAAAMADELGAALQELGKRIERGFLPLADRRRPRQASGGAKSAGSSVPGRPVRASRVS
jgi:DNA-binding transcriptional LysR family regulator